MIGGSELLVIFLIILLLFGGEKMPEVARGIGKAIREFKKVTAGVENEFKKAMAEPPPPAAPKSELPSASPAKTEPYESPYPSSQPPAEPKP